MSAQVGNASVPPDLLYRAELIAPITLLCGCFAILAESPLPSLSHESSSVGLCSQSSVLSHECQLVAELDQYRDLWHSQHLLEDLFSKVHVYTYTILHTRRCLRPCLPWHRLHAGESLHPGYSTVWQLAVQAAQKSK